MAKKDKQIPVEAVQELADKAAQAASIGGTDASAETGVVETEVKAEEAPNPNQVQVNVDFLRTTKVHIAMPCYGGMLTESTFMSYIKFANQARQLGVDWTLETMVNESLISRARNTLTAKFLHQKESTHLHFIDADIGWEPWHLLVLLNHDKDICAGLYPMKTMPLKWVVNGFEGAEQGENGLQEVSKAGTGFLLTKRHVFEKMREHPAVKPYKNDIGLDPVYDQYLATYFDTAVRQNRYYSEDWTMCENWRDMGGRIWADRRVLLRHAGHFNFCQESHDHLLNSFGPMYLEQLKAQGKVQMLGEDGKVVA
jgi:hypothetical protein